MSLKAQKSLQEPVSVHGFGLSRAETQALMAAFLIGRRQGSIVKYGALGQLAQRLSPDGMLVRLADAYVEATNGQMEAAASRVQTIVIRNPADASKRNEAANMLKSLARLVSAKRQVRGQTG